MNTDDEKALKVFLQGRLPMICLVRQSDLIHIRGFSEDVIDRGQKDARKPLAIYLLAKEKIPLISCDYTTAGRLKQGVRGFYDKAVGAGGGAADQNVYFLGIDAGLFQALWEESGQKIASQQKITAYKEAPQNASDIFPPGHDSDKLKILEKAYLGSTKEIDLIRKFILVAARHDFPTLILGETGTGKEIVAHHIQQFSQNCPGKFVKINCGAIPDNLLESFLFGHEKGAFTDAVKRVGLWQEADKGVLYLDEIGDISLQHQVKILRALETGEINRIGRNDPIRIKTKVVAATNRDLHAMVKMGQFREDLFYRLGIIVIHTPALRDHKRDIPELAQHFWAMKSDRKCQVLPDEVLGQLRQYDWPGNVRELKNTLDRLYALYGGEDRITSKHIQITLKLGGGPMPDRSEVGLSTVHSEVTAPDKCFRHLRRTLHLLERIRNLLDPLPDMAPEERGRKKSLFFNLRLLMDELESLCNQPLYFCDEITFDAMNQIRSKLIYFHGLFKKDDQAALDFWRDTGTTSLKTGIDQIHTSIGECLEQIS